MKIKAYIKGMLFIALPASIVGVLLAFLITDPDNILFSLFFYLAPFFWVVDRTDLTISDNVFLIAQATQFIYWSILILILKYLWRKRNSINT